MGDREISQDRIQWALKRLRAAQKQALETAAQ